MRRMPILALVVATLISGCADGGAADPAADAVDEISAEPTDPTSAVESSDPATPGETSEGGNHDDSHSGDDGHSHDGAPEGSSTTIFADPGVAGGGDGGHSHNLPREDLGPRVPFSEIPQVAVEPERIWDHSDSTLVYYDIGFSDFVRLQRAAFLKAGVTLSRDVQTSSSWVFVGTYKGLAIDGSVLDCQYRVSGDPGSEMLACGYGGEQPTSWKVQLFVVKDPSTT